LDLIDDDEDVDNNEDMLADGEFHSPEFRQYDDLARVPTTHQEIPTRDVHSQPIQHCYLPTATAIGPIDIDDSTVPTWREWGGNSFPSYHDELEETPLTLVETQNIDRVRTRGRALWVKWDETAEHEQFIADGAVIGAALRAAAALITEHDQTQQC
jgi:hypothetical protein